jgi:hypothetical protein
MLTVVLDYCLLVTSPTYRADRSFPSSETLDRLKWHTNSKSKGWRRRGEEKDTERNKKTTKIKEDREKTRAIQRKKRKTSSNLFSMIREFALALH